MTLTTHAIVGVAAARLFPAHPVIAFTAAFASHFLIDAIPHWDYHLHSSRVNEHDPLDKDMEVGGLDFYLDLLKIGFDICIGLLLSYLIFYPSNAEALTLVAIGAIGGILPDPLQFLYFKYRKEPMITLQRFHDWIHTDIKLRGRWIIGPLLQFFMVYTLVSISFLILP